MSDVVIQAENLGKKYLIGHQSANERYVALRDLIAQNVKRIWRTTQDLLHGRPLVQGETLEEVWALKDVSFEVKRGEVIGIIGRNGAGKSTLLKILSRITEPTEGRVRIRGRVASLLEVGTGFHPELTGRENIFLNGAILGMTRQEIKRKLDEIVAFADIEKYLDTPVKRYSSGMYVRLAFAVAAHLEPEILLVDEVLAVGDAEFQRKCLGKLQGVAEGGRTVLFVSHNMAAVERLCHSVHLMEQGRFAGGGDPATTIYDYLRHGLSGDADVDLMHRSIRQTPDRGILTRLRILAPDGTLHNVAQVGQDLRFEVHVESPQRLRDANMTILLCGPLGQVVAKCYSKQQYSCRIEVFDRCVFACVIHNCRLAPGTYTVSLLLRDGPRLIDRVDSVATVEFFASDIYNTGKRSDRSSEGFYLPHVDWEVSRYRSRQMLTTET